MGKGLPIYAIVSAVVALLAALVLVNAAVFLVLPVVLGGSIILLMQRNLHGAIAGLVVLALGVVAAMGLAGSITREGGATTDFGISEAMGRVWAILACLAIPMGAVAVRWTDIQPQWLAYVGIGGTVLAFILALVNQDSLADQSDAGALVTGLLCLSGIVPMVGLLRGSDAPESAPASE